MKKFIIIAIALIAVAVGVYFYKNKSSDAGSSEQSIVSKIMGNSDSPVLAYVPADTVFFGGSLESMSFDKAMELSRNMGFDFTSFIALADSDTMKVDDKAPDAAKLGFGIYKAYLEAFTGDLPKVLGVSDQLDTALYTVGALPVLRMSLNGTSTFSDLIAKIEKDQGISPKVGNVGGVEYREYTFDQVRVNGEKEDVPVSLVLSIHDNQVAITVNTILDDSKDLKVALADKPAQSIAASSTLNNLMSKYGYQGYNLFYMDNLAVVKGITDPTANSFGGMLQDLLAAYGNPTALAELQTPSCKTEYTELMANWPTISAGYTEIGPKAAKYKMMIEGTNAGLLETLQKLQGHLSPMLDDENFLFSMGMGLNMGELTPVVTDIWKRMVKEPYNCGPLAEMQAEMKQNNPMMQLGMVGGMLGGIKGLGFAVVDMDINGLQNLEENPMAVADTMNMFVTLSADDPMALVAMAGQFIPGLADIDLKDGGEPQNLPTPLQATEVKGTLRGHDLIVSVGNRANTMANSLKVNKNIDYNGLFSFKMDIGKYFGMIDELGIADENAGKLADLSDEQKKVFEMFKNVKGKVSEKINFTNQGLAIDVSMVVE